MSTITLKSGVYFPYLIRFNFEHDNLKFLRAHSIALIRSSVFTRFLNLNENSKNLRISTVENIK